MAMERWRLAADMGGTTAGPGAGKSSGYRLAMVRKERISSDSLRLYRPEHLEGILRDLVAQVVGWQCQLGVN